MVIVIYNTGCCECYIRLIKVTIQTKLGSAATQQVLHSVIDRVRLCMCFCLYNIIPTCGKSHFARVTLCMCFCHNLRLVANYIPLHAASVASPFTIEGAGHDRLAAGWDKEVRPF